MTHRIHFDITGLLTWGEKPPTGIQRVEQGLLAEALAHGDIGFIAFEWPGVNCRKIPRATARSLLVREPVGKPSPDPIGRFSRIRQHFFLKFRFGKNTTARELAQIALGQNVDSGLLYQATKTGFRLAQWLALLVREGFRLVQSPFRTQTPFSKDDVILFCHDSGRLVGRSKPPVEGNPTLAILIHDLMPIARPDFSSAARRQSMTALLGKALRKSDVIITTSNTVKADIENFNRTECGTAYRRQVKAIRLGTTRVNQMTDERPIAELDGRKFVLFCSTIETKKGHHTLVAAWQLLIEWLGEDKVPLLVFIGIKSSGYDRLQTALAANPVARAKIMILHDIDDARLRWAYTHADFSLFASSFEGWGLGVSESLGFGLPVVHSPLPALREASQGIMPEPAADTPEAWAATLAPLLSEPALMDELRQTIARQYQPGKPDDFAKGVWNYLEKVAHVSDIELK